MFVRLSIIGQLTSVFIPSIKVDYVTHCHIKLETERQSFISLNLFISVISW